LGIQATTGADTQVCPYDDLRISLKSRTFSNWFHLVSASHLSRRSSRNSYVIARSYIETNIYDLGNNRFIRGDYLREDFRLTRFVRLAGVQRSAMVVWSRTPMSAARALAQSVFSPQEGSNSHGS
jgi:hypothetical protein